MVVRMEVVGVVLREFFLEVVIVRLFVCKKICVSFFCVFYFFIVSCMVVIF